MSASSIARWLRDAALDFGWRDVGCVVAVGAFPLFFGPHGGGIFVVFDDPSFDAKGNLARAFVLDLVSIGLPLVFAVKVANRAIADAVPRWLAYSAVLLATGAVRQLCIVTGFLRVANQPTVPGEIAWYYMAIFLQGGIGLVIYARWRAAQQSMRLVQENETRRARTAQRLQSARLLTLQARVDPQLLFDSLARVGVLQRSDPAAAEVLLSDLISLLRAMLPGETTLTSTVEREFAVIDSWLRVTRAVAGRRADVVLHAVADIAPSRLAPLLALPLLRAALEVSGADAVAWRLEAVAAGGRLLLTLGAAPEAAERAAAVLARADVVALRDRLASLHGDDAAIWSAERPPTVTIAVPFAVDETDAIDADADAVAAARMPAAQELAP